VLTIRSMEDVAAFLDDADAARADGIFVKALRSPFTLLADACAWGGPEACATGRVTRALANRAGELRVAHYAPPIGTTDQDHLELVRAARRLLYDTAQRRGCATCPVAPVCSKDICLSGLLGDAAYCGHRRSRPWLAAYLEALEALRYAGTDPDDPGDLSRDPVRVAGFGGGLEGSLPAGWPDRPPVVLMAQGGRFFGHVPATPTAFKLSHDAALLCEVVVATPVPEAAGVAAERFGISVAGAQAGIDRLAAMLAVRGLHLNPDSRALAEARP